MTTPLKPEHADCEYSITGADARSQCDDTVLRRFRGYYCHCTVLTALSDSTPPACPTHGAPSVLAEEVTPAKRVAPLGLMPCTTCAPLNAVGTSSNG